MLGDEIYMQDLSEVAELPIPWSEVKNKSVFITGATGLIGSFLTDLLMYRNEIYDDNIKIIALGRNEDNAKIRFEKHFKSKYFVFINQDISDPIKIDYSAEYVLHAASNANPIAFAMDPVGTMTANFLGMYNLLQYARAYNVKRTLFISTGEVYGESQDGADFKEDYCGHIDYTNPRACYPSSKRAAETLCASFMQQYGMNVVMARPCHIYGATFTKSDSRAFAQFMRKVNSNEDIVMKSEGLQTRSYCYVADAVSALLHILFYGEPGEAYNIANKNSNVTIRQLAECIAKISKRKVRFEVPDEVEKSGYSKVTKAVFDATKLEMLGWQAKIGIQEGLERTIKILSI